MRALASRGSRLLPTARVFACFRSPARLQFGAFYYIENEGERGARSPHRHDDKQDRNIESDGAQDGREQSPISSLQLAVRIALVDTKREHFDRRVADDRQDPPSRARARATTRGAATPSDNNAGDCRARASTFAAASSSSLSSTSSPPSSLSSSVHLDGSERLAHLIRAAATRRRYRPRAQSGRRHVIALSNDANSALNERARLRRVRRVQSARSDGARQEAEMRTRTAIVLPGI